MPSSGVPVRATFFLRDPSTGLSQNGVYDILEESQKRSVIISSRIQGKQRKQREAAAQSSSVLNWKIYATHLSAQYRENLRFNNEVRKEYMLFISLISTYLLGDTYAGCDEATYFILRGIYRIFKYTHEHYGEDAKIGKFTQSILGDIAKYFDKLSSKHWDELNHIGLKLLFLAAQPDEHETHEVKCLADLSDELLRRMDYESIALFSKDAPSEAEADSGAAYTLGKKEYGRGLEFKDPLVEMNQLLLPMMTPLEKKQHADESHNPMLSARFQKPAKSKTPPKAKPKKPKPKPKVKTPYGMTWIREKAQHIAMMQLQVRDAYPTKCIILALCDA